MIPIFKKNFIFLSTMKFWPVPNSLVLAPPATHGSPDPCWRGLEGGAEPVLQGSQLLQAQQVQAAFGGVSRFVLQVVQAGPQQLSRALQVGGLALAAQSDGDVEFVEGDACGKRGDNSAGGCGWQCLLHSSVHSPLSRERCAGRRSSSTSRISWQSSCILPRACGAGRRAASA